MKVALNKLVMMGSAEELVRCISCEGYGLEYEDGSLRSVTKCPRCRGEVWVTRRVNKLKVWELDRLWRK